MEDIMYRTAVILTSVILVFALVAGCGKSQEQKNLEKAAQTMDEAAQQMAEAGEQIKEGGSEGIEAMAEAMKKMGQAISDSAVEPVDFRELKALLPEALDGLPRTNASGEKNSAMGIKLSQATGDYQNDEGKSINIEIYDYASMQKMVMMAQFGWAVTDFDRETDTGYEKSITWKGMRGIERYENESQYGQIQILVAERFVVDVEGYSVKIEDVRNALEKIDLKKLASFKDK